MLQILCILCENELKEPGAIVISPPTREKKCKEVYICRKCWRRLKRELKNKE